MKTKKVKKQKYTKRSPYWKNLSNTKSGKSIVIDSITQAVSPWKFSKTKGDAYNKGYEEGRASLQNYADALEKLLKEPKQDGRIEAVNKILLSSVSMQEATARIVLALTDLAVK